MSREATQAGEGDCGTDECEVTTGRRTFLRDGLMAVAALTAIAGAAAPLHALAREYATGRAGAAGMVSYGIPAGDGATIDRTNKVILVRYQGMVHAFDLECPHKGTAVQWQPEQNRFYCPKHKSTFKAEGTRIQGKSPRSLDRYAVRIEGGKVVVDTGTVIDAEANAAGWSAAGVRVG
ncbi:MAG: Rieske (2Fe-2S) protein [Gemmatimonadetes bacterium]|nr:Rieske (2Fe-2S) protein [Gemmatimonadota bacterium]